MEQHPIPQPVSSYEFQLIGSMTLKQFAKLTSCVLVALFFYSLPLPAFLKWPLIILFVLLGLGLAFFSINERPLDVWIISFFKAVFSPTQYIWRRTPLSKQTTSSFDITPISKTTPPSSNPTIILNQTSLSPTFTNHQVITEKSEIQEEKFLQNINSLFATAVPPKPKSTFIPPPPPSLPKESAVEAKSAQKDSFPFAPAMPNIICGVVKNNEGQLITGAILEVRDDHGISVRAMRTNKLGQFLTATSLPNGIYEISTEKEGLSFAIIKLNLIGGILSPVEIVAK